MRELRVQSGGKPIRIFYAFDPRRAAILLIGGRKSGKKRFYDQTVPIADRLYDEHLADLRAEERKEKTYGRTTSVRGTSGQDVTGGARPQRLNGYGARWIWQNSAGRSSFRNNSSQASSG